MQLVPHVQHHKLHYNLHHVCRSLMPVSLELPTLCDTRGNHESTCSSKPDHRRTLAIRLWRMRARVAEKGWGGRTCGRTLHHAMDQAHHA
jgi:hypothetical protein